MSAPIGSHIGYTVLRFAIPLYVAVQDGRIVDVVGDDAALFETGPLTPTHVPPADELPDFFAALAAVRSDDAEWPAWRFGW